MQEERRGFNVCYFYICCLNAGSDLSAQHRSREITVMQNDITSVQNNINSVQNTLVKLEGKLLQLKEQVEGTSFLKISHFRGIHTKSDHIGTSDTSSVSRVLNS
jgi:septal ring factor EnvC (AmiA/AmiB activator)